MTSSKSHLLRKCRKENPTWLLFESYLLGKYCARYMADVGKLAALLLLPIITTRWWSHYPSLKGRRKPTSLLPLPTPDRSLNEREFPLFILFPHRSSQRGIPPLPPSPPPENPQTHLGSLPPPLLYCVHVVEKLLTRRGEVTVNACLRPHPTLLFPSRI